MSVDATENMVTMKALHLTQFCQEGKVADEISFGDIPVPTSTPLKQDVLIQIKASAINVDDVACCQNTAMGGWWMHPRAPNKEKPLVPGCEYAGVVLAIGPDCKRLKVGDRVCGVHNPVNHKVAGTWAEQALAPENDIVLIPSDLIDLSHVQAAASGMSAFVVGDMYKRAKDNFPAKGGRCVVIGASGGLGTILLQLLRKHGDGKLHIAAVCSGTNAQMVTRLGANEVIDYKNASYGEQLGREGMNKFDVVFDFFGGLASERDAAQVLRYGGRYITAVGPMSALGDRTLTCCEFHGWCCGLIFRICGCCCCVTSCKFGYEMAGSMPPLTAPDFQSVVVDAGIRPEIAMEVPFAEAPLREALRRVASRHTKGKVVMNMELDNK